VKVLTLRQGEPAAAQAVAPGRPLSGLAAWIAIAAAALTFVTDAMSDTVSLVRAMRRRGTVRIADARHLAR
jgi:hypothetical protein